MADAPGAGEQTYLLEQRFRYDYASPIRRLRHQLMVVPPVGHGGQHRDDHGVSVSGSPVLMSVRSDAFANHVVELRATDVGAWIEFAAWARVTHRGPGGQASVPIRAFTDRRLLRATPLTEADDALRDAASRLAAAGAGGVALAERICAWVHGTMTYEDGVTGVDTTAAAALAGGRGVCQDYAHVMLAVGRAAGLPCRYVSGHLVGEGGSHAWVEAVVPDASPAGAGRAVAIAFDPTHDRRAVTGYLTVAVGRDYADVAPTSGTFEGDGPGVLTACKQLTRLAAETTEPVATASP